MTTLGSRVSRWPVSYSLLSGFLVLAAAVILLIATRSTAGAAVAPVDLAAAGSFAVLGGSAVTNTGLSIINGDLGVSPGSAITGIPPGIVNGSIYQTDAVAADAQSGLAAAYNDASRRAPTAGVPSFIGAGQTLLPGVYKATSSLDVGGGLTLNGQGDPNSVFIFQVGSTLGTDSASDISLTNGAQACNVFWQVGSSATLGASSTFLGSILALASITVNAGDTIEGRALASNGAVTLDDDVITVPACAPPISPTPTPSTTSASPSPTPSTTSASPTPTPSTTSTNPSPTPAPSPTPVHTTLPVTG